MPRLSATLDVDVPFFDVDAMDIVWHGHYVKYFELARCALLERIDYNYPQMKASGIEWPVVDLRIRYPRPARFNQRLQVRATLTDWESRLRIAYEVVDAESGARLTRGHTVQVPVDMASGKRLPHCPDALLTRLENVT
ncbi:acyl-CoA thioesterase [Larsenimonas suaedae]|uniref:Acyl-CoA thioesterase n=1 Tax=Larsenimonas suaedae TaxID=1851019 RepID=A0ABU1GWR0_9GAMM|nr:acyl-CoA thioesterase [Larsenimonas suaedae]MCM2973053.1 acyl-CoA thioesterase [Larsenimonas suaedae]MDR5896490.1 acyl-CoA thioesterase [Larsenimonas suaedae]